MAPQVGSPGPALRYPRSFLGLLVIGLLLVALPLAAALLYSAWSTQHLAEQSRSAVYNAAQAARASRALVNRIGSLERLSLQMAVVPDADLLNDFEQLHEGFLQITAELGRLPLDARQLAALDRTVARERVLHELMTAPAKPDVALVRARVVELAESAHEVLAISARVADQEVERLRASAEYVQTQLLSLVLVAIAVALIASLVLTRAVAVPMAQLDAAIRQLGGPDFSQPVRVGGPQDLRDLGKRLDWLRQRLAELEAQKNRFLRHLSHELKTPLASLREGAELLNDQVAGPLAPPQRAVVAIMRDNSVKLQKLIEDLLDYQRALHAASSLDVSTVRLDALVREVADAHRLAALSKAQRIELDLAPVVVEADAEKLRSIIDNLLGNAIKFTPACGTIAVRAKERNGGAAIEVIDSGPGVPEVERDSVFESFFRGRAKAGGRVEGSGLGLAIAREYVEAHGGRIALLSEGSGGHFCVTLPKRPQAAVLGEPA
ncbi:MAG TPA: HAMP domain-containing sensor histidine kinase [Burkholderiales bacterium]|nr:HAMP domain-containing sensor histidine kinase [Burkholderiales bacterium]